MITKVLCLFLVVVFSFAMIPVAEAKWVDRSGELPGMEGGSSPMLIVAGALLVGAVVFMIAKKSKKSATAEDKIKASIDWQLSSATTNSCVKKTNMKSANSSVPQLTRYCY